MGIRSSMQSEAKALPSSTDLVLEDQETSGFNEQLAVRTQIKNAYYFTSDPQLDPLMQLIPGTLLNGFETRVGGRIPSESFFAFLDTFIRTLLDEYNNGDGDPANARLLFEIIVGTNENDLELAQAQSALRVQIDAFARNRVVFPYNLLCDFDPYGSTGYFLHTKGLALARKVDSLVEMEQEWKEREIRIVPFMQEHQLWQVRYIIFLHGAWNEHGLPSSVILLVGELVHEHRNLLKRFLDPRNTNQKLYYLGTQKHLTSKDRFFEDMSILENHFRERKGAFFFKIAKLRFWVSRADSVFQGSILGMQYFHGEMCEFELPIHGSKSTAQFFVDVVIAKNERISEMSGYWDGEMLGTLTITVSSGHRYRIGRRAVGRFFSVTFDDKQDFEMMSFSGEVGLTDNVEHLQSLQVVFCRREHFFTASMPQAETELLDGSSVTIGGIPSSTPEMGHSGQHFPGNSSMAHSRPSSSIGRATPTTSRGLDFSSGSKSFAKSRKEIPSSMISASLHRSPSPAASLRASVSFAASKDERLRMQESQKFEGEADSCSWHQELQAAVIDGRATALTKFIFQVEYCTAERPTASLRGSSKQYLQVAVDLKQKAKLVLWEYNISVLRNAKFERWGKENNLVSSPMKPRIGSCEIWLSWQHQGTPYTILLHSKLVSRRWPCVDVLCSELVSLLPTQYHDIRFLVETEQGPLDGVIVTVKMTEGKDSLKILGHGNGGEESRSNLTIATDRDGLVSISLPAGVYEIRMTHAKNAPLAFVYTLGSPQDGNYEPFKRILMTGKIEPDKIYFVLEWGSLPEDLDLFAVTPHDKVFFANPRDHLMGGTCTLDCDVRDGFGPEIMSISRMSSSVVQQLIEQRRSTLCHVYIYQYSDGGSLATSGAVLKVLLNSKELFKIKVPARGIGQFWDAFTIDLADLSITSRNRIIPSEPSFDVVGPDGQVTPSCAMGKARFDAVKPSPLAAAASQFAPVRTSSAVLHEHKDHTGVR